MGSNTRIRHFVRAARWPAVGPSAIPGRPYRLLGVGNHRGLAVANVDSSKRRLHQRSAQRRGSASCSELGLGQRHRRGRSMQTVRRWWHYAPAHAAAYYLARRQHPEDRDRRRHTNAPFALRQYCCAERRKNLAGAFGRAMGLRVIGCWRDAWARYARFVEGYNNQYSRRLSA